MPSTIELNLDAQVAKIKSAAYSRVASYSMHSTAIQMDQYLQKNYKNGIKSICKWLVLKKIIVNTGADDKSLVITFKDPESDKLAALITYGNSEVPGCDILKFAFNQTNK